MNWTLVLTLIINTSPLTVQLTSLDTWVCSVMASGAKNKTIVVNNHPVQLQKAECKQSI